MTTLKFNLALMMTLLASCASAGAACRHVAHLGADYTVCAFDPKTSGIRVFNSDRSGTPYRSFDALARDLRIDREYLDFAVNGGMYHDDLSPVGLLVETGLEKHAISTKAGWGNFHLLPNGVFFIEPGKAGVLDTQHYLKAGVKPLFATQSGPMLVIAGKVHPKFLPDSDSFKIRNGVGVGRDGRVHFAISNAPVRFHDFATLYRDVLDCPNALFLDGSISSLYAPDIERHDALFPMGSIIAVISTRPG